MPNRARRSVLIGVASLALGAVGFGVSETLEVFAPCRVMYRHRNPVQDSPACRMFSTIGNVSVAMVVISLLLFGLAVVQRMLPSRDQRDAVPKTTRIGGG